VDLYVCYLYTSGAEVPDDFRNTVTNRVTMTVCEDTSLYRHVHKRKTI